MKTVLKIQILAVILASMFVTAQAQQTSTENPGRNNRNIWFGLRAGSDFASPATDFDVIKDQINSNMQVGAFVKMGKKIFLQPELYGNFLVESNEFNSRQFVANSVRVPVLLGFRFLNLGVASAHLMAGPMATYYLKPSSEQRYDYKLQLGGGVELLKFISLDVRYSANLNKDIKQELKNLTWNSGVNVTLGIMFR